MSILGGILSIGGALLSKRSADKQGERAAESDAAQLDFAKEQYEDWQAVYGPLQDNLAEYYGGLDAEFYASVGLENFQVEQQKAISNIESNLAQAGIDPRSGISQSLTAQAELAGAEQRAEIRRDAPRAVAEDKSRFLQIGMGNNPTSSVQSVLNQQASAQNNKALMYEQAAGQAMQSAISTVGKTFTDMTKAATAAAGGG